MSTADPGATSTPPTGSWLMTWPAGTVALNAWVTVPTVKPAPVRAVAAAAWVMPTTSGTATGSGPLETTMSTADPGATSAAAAGFWLMTCPAGTVPLKASVAVPTARPAPVSAASAAACVRPTTSGTAIWTGSGPLETVRFTAKPGMASVAASGFWLMTCPAGTVSLKASVTVPTARPAPVRAASAAACVMPTTLGTVTCPGSGPLETVRFTADPGAAMVPATGSCAVTCPAGAVAS